MQYGETHSIPLGKGLSLCHIMTIFHRVHRTILSSTDSNTKDSETIIRLFWSIHSSVVFAARGYSRLVLSSNMNLGPCEIIIRGRQRDLPALSVMSTNVDKHSFPCDQIIVLRPGPGYSCCRNRALHSMGSLMCNVNVRGSSHLNHLWRHNQTLLTPFNSPVLTP